MNQVQMRQCCKNAVSGGMVGGAIRSLVNARGLQLECANVLYRLCLCLFLCMVARQ